MKLTFLKKTIAMFLAAATVLCTSQTTLAAATASYAISGNSCVPINGEAVTRSQWGMYMSGYYPADVVCPIITDGNPWSALSFNVYGYDRNASDLLSCTLMITDYAGNIISTNVIAMTGASYNVQSPGVFLPYPFPGFSTNTNFSVTCHLPGRTITGAVQGFSHLTTLELLKFE
jgi:hypothetical protein